jgi:hypothetical protein
VAPRTDKTNGARIRHREGRSALSTSPDDGTGVPANVPDPRPDGLPATNVGPGSSEADEVSGVVRTAVDAAARAGATSAAGLGEALERAGRSLAGRVVANAAARRHPLPDRSSLARALSERPPTPAIAGAAAAAVGLRFLTRFRRLGGLAKRTPLWLLATAVPALVASVTRGSDELGMVAAHLIHRARAAGVEPDLDRVRRAAVQIVSHRVVDPDSEPSHGALAVQWLRRAVRAALPFTSGVATADPEGLAAAASDLDPQLLAAQPEA